MKRDTCDADRHRPAGVDGYHRIGEDPARIRARAGKAENYGSRLVCGEGIRSARSQRFARLQRGIHGPRRALGPVLLGHRARGTTTTTGSSSRRTRRVLPNAGRHRRHVQLPEPHRVLVRHGSVRQPVGARVHARPVHAEQRREHLRRRRPDEARLHRLPPGHGVPGAAVLPARLGPFEEAISCDPTKWCAAMAIFSFNSDQNTGVANNADCLNTVGIEPANFAFITKSGVPHAPPAPLEPDGRTRSRPTRRPTCSWIRETSSTSRSTTRRLGWSTSIADLTSGQIGLDDGEHRERVRAGELRPERRDLHADAVRVPPDVRDLERAHPGAVGGALVQRGLRG